MKKHQAKMTVTLSMIFIATMALASTPSWLRAARDFIMTKSGGTAAPPPKGASRDTRREQAGKPS